MGRLLSTPQENPITALFHSIGSIKRGARDKRMCPSSRRGFVRHSIFPSQRVISHLTPPPPIRRDTRASVFPSCLRLAFKPDCQKFRSRAGSLRGCALRHTSPVFSLTTAHRQPAAGVPSVGCASIGGARLRLANFWQSGFALRAAANLLRAAEQSSLLGKQRKGGGKYRRNRIRILAHLLYFL
jgi:hypothetical protein